MFKQDAAADPSIGCTKGFSAEAHQPSSPFLLERNFWVTFLYEKSPH